MGRQARKTFVYVMGAITKNRAGQELAEMGLMTQAGAVGFTDDGCGVQDAGMMLRAMKYSSMFDQVISQHCEDRSLAKDGVMNAGYKASVLGLPGVDPLAEEMMLWRDIQLTKKTKARYHAQHISTASSVEIIREAKRTKARYHAQHISTASSVEIIREAKRQGLPVTCEVTPHHLLLTEEAVADYDSNFKVNPPLRTQKDIESLRQAVADGIVDALATDHAPHLQSEKELEFLSAPCGMVGIECALPLYRKALIDTGACDWSQMLAMLTWRPAEIINAQKGSLAVDDRADIVIIDPDAQWSIDANKFYSKSRNCPYQGWDVKGKVLYTLVAGEVRFEAKD
jgi:dihydroorotase